MTPESNLIILKGVPFSSTYQDLLTFSNESAQQSYFMGLAKFPAFSDFTYVRNQEGYPIRVEINAEQLQDCDYIMFQNSAYGNKWFYAFITDVQYRADETSFIYFSLDIWQTWQFNFDVKQCFVEREHVNDDTIGLHTLPENLELGPYITTSQSNIISADLSVYMLATEVPENLSVYFEDPGLYGKFPIACYLAKFGTLTSFSASAVKLVVDGFAEAGKSDAIVSIFCAPTEFVSTQETIRVRVLQCAPRTLSIIPKNNKLFTYPYCALSVTAGPQNLTLRYENFSTPPSFSIYGGFGANMGVVGVPNNYEGVERNFMVSLTLSGWPFVPWTNNYYTNWLAQNKANLAMDAVNYGVQTIEHTGRMLAGDVGSIGAQLKATINYVGGQLQKEYNADIIPDKTNGGVNAADIMAVMGESGFRSYCRTIKAEYAQIIDNFFTVFGYKVNQVKSPNLTGRQNWNYVKTSNAIVNGAVPANILRAFENILNNGATFWHTTDIGNYSLPNAIVGGV